jgi:ABC-type sugar transport system substrate-binding protein
VVFEKGKPKELIQVCYDLTADNLERETSGLLAAMDYFNMSLGKIVTLKQKDSFKKDGKKIDVVPLNQFLME